MRCPKCGLENRNEARYCGHCGIRMVCNCQTCGLVNPVSYQFCDRCGSPLSDTAQRPQVTLSHTQSVSPQPVQEPLPVDLPMAQPQPSIPQSQTLVSDSQVPPARENHLQGERRVATIILADVHSSTNLLERLGTEPWVEIMNHVFQILEAEIYRFGGKVDQFRGDGLVAFFGANTAHEDDPERAVLAALAMQKALRPYAAELAEDADVTLSLRVGVNTGEVIVTSVGDRRQYSEHTAMGEAIALAARMETAAEPGTVLVSENTYQLVQKQFEWESLGEIMVKGVSHPIAVYRPLAPKADIERADAYELSNPLIGRKEEFETLKACIEDLRDGRGGIVTLVGDKGMGKSLLVREVRHYFARQEVLLAEARDRHITASAASVGLRLDTDPTQQCLLRGRCRSYDQTQPYAMWLDLLYNWLDVRQDEPKDDLRDRLRDEAQTLWGDRMFEYYPYLAKFMSLPLEPSLAEQIHQLDAEARRQQFFLAIRSWVEALASEGPLAINFSDMHWADNTSLDLLKYCLSLCDYVPILWLLVFRPERESPMWKFRYYLETDYPHRLSALTLQALDKIDSERFIEQLIGAEVLPQETLDLIIDKAEGNPYYIQELVRALITQGVLVKQMPDETEEASCVWHVVETVTSLDLPDSLQTLLLARIDRLPPQEHTALQMAAVIGPTFWSNVLQALIGEDAPLHKYLTALLRAQLIRERGRVPDLGAEYVFKSPLIRDAAYDSLLSAQRASAHLQIAQYLEQRFDPQARASYFGALAYHYHHAGHMDKELFYTLQHAEQAKEVYANVEAGEHYTKALALLDVLDAQTQDETALRALYAQRFDVLHARCEIFSLMGKFEAMRKDAEALLPLARKLPEDKGRLIDALLQQPGVADYHDRAKVEAATKIAEEALDLARQTGDQRREMEVLTAIANQRLSLNHPAWQQAAEQALDLSRTLEDHRYEARLLVGLGRLYAQIDQPERSMEYLEAAAALSLSEGIDDIRVQISLLALLGLEFERSGDYTQLLADYQLEQLHLSREIGHRPLESKALLACGLTQGLYLGDYEAGLGMLEESRHILEGTSGENHALLAMVQMQIALGAYEKAKANLTYIHQSGEYAEDPDRVHLDLVEAMLYTELGSEEDLSQALVLTDRVRRVASEHPLLSRQYEMAAASKAVTAHLNLAKFACSGTECELHELEALKASRAAYDLYQSFGYAQIVECVSEEVLFHHGQALAANGYEDEAIKYLRWAYDEMIRKYALVPPDSPFRRTYLDNIPLHQDIRIAYAARVGSILTESGQIYPVGKRLERFPEG